MAISVRMASLQDAALIADLSRQTFHESYALHNTQENMDKFMNEQFSRQALMEEVGTVGNIFFIAFEGNEALGYVRLREASTPTGLGNAASIEIARIYVLHKSKGKGIGKMLILQSIATAKELGKQILWLGVWENNQHAIDFYTKFGFEKFAEHPFILGDDVQTDWLMKKAL